MVRKNNQVETRMVAEYLKATYSTYPFIIAQPLGKVDETLQAQVGTARAIKISRPFRPEVDAVVILPRHLIIIEAKVWNIVNGLAKLPLYKSLVAHTPELQQYQPREVIMELVVGWTNSNLDIMAREMDVRVKVYCPPWLEEVVESQHRYWLPEYRTKREQVLRDRELLGLD